MDIAGRLIVAAESLPVPDAISRAGINFLVARSRKHLDSDGAIDDPTFVRMMADRPIAVHTDKANEQHYEVPANFFRLCLGSQRKYSCCFYETDNSTLDEAEVAALRKTVIHANLSDGQRILEMGCGWGSLSLYMAQMLPGSHITAVSNSHSQRAHIETTALERGITNLEVVTCDMNEFQASGQYDRIVSVEMFEHMSNWRALLGKARGWLKEDGRMFMHVFSHRKSAYLFDENDRSDWIAQHFFTGGIMPSHTLMRQFSDIFTIEKEWSWNGKHYARTARHWLENFDANEAEISHLFARVYGTDATLWKRRWRLFFLATEGLFGHADGNEWGVSHYLMAPAGHG